MLTTMARRATTGTAGCAGRQTHQVSTTNNVDARNRFGLNPIGLGQSCTEICEIASGQTSEASLGNYCSSNFLLPRTSLPFRHWPLRLCDSLLRDHRIRLRNCFPQFIVTQRIQPVQHHPFVSPDIRRRTDVFPLAKFGKMLRCALETNLVRHRIQPQDHKDFPIDLEAKIVFPLQVFLCRRK